LPQATITHPSSKLGKTSIEAIVMTFQKPLDVNFKQKDDILQVLPRLPLRTSNQLGWHGIEVQQHLNPVWETPEHSHALHMLVIAPLENYAIQSERKLDTTHQHEDVLRGKTAIVPAQVPHQSNWKTDLNSGNAFFTLVMLEPDFLAHLAHESVNVDHVELLPMFAVDDPVFYRIGSLLQMELGSDCVNSRLYVDGLITALSAHLLRQYCTVQQTLRNYEGGLPQYKLKQAISYIHDHLSENLSLAEMAQEVEMSQYYFCRLFKQSTGSSPYQYLIEQRVERAKELLNRGNMSIADVASSVGFCDQSRLTKYFKRLTGLTPKHLRNQ
jgi:AraC family transcriptional regulator